MTMTTVDGFGGGSAWGHDAGAYVGGGVEAGG
jgi:hypothetical protein